jgi:hypothetical protein
MTPQELKVRFKARHPDFVFPSDLKEKDPDTVLVPFGMYRGHPIEDLLSDRDYVEWMVEEPGMLADLQAKYPALGKILTEVLKRLGYPVEYAPKRRPGKVKFVTGAAGAKAFREARARAKRASSAPNDSRIGSRPVLPRRQVQPGTFEALKAKAREVQAKTAAATAGIKTLYDEFLALDIDVTALSPEDQKEYAAIMDSLRKQRVSLER